MSKKIDDTVPIDSQAGNEGESAMQQSAALDSSLADQLREANQNLVLATVRAHAMVEKAQRATHQMTFMAEHDVLTGLPNRSLLNDRLSQAIIYAQRQRKKVALLFLDLDHFKHINDTLGHNIGDRLLQAVALRLQASVRQSDTVSRQGGDEFILLLAELDRGYDASLFADKLIHNLAAPYLINGNQLHITLSIGISIYPDDGDSAEAVIRNADTAMYHAKENGRNHYQFYTQNMNDRAVERISLESSLQLALEQEQFVLYYQPRIDLDSGRIIGVEALIRWNHPTRGLILPEQFISIAEDCGLIVPLGHWIVGEACRQMKTWVDQGLALKQMAVNISAVEFRHAQFLQNMHDILGETGLAAHYLELEVIESVLMQDTQPATALVQALRSLGVKIAIDNFGTGYSSLSYLRRFPIDTLKIDQSCVHDVNSSPNEAAIVSAVIAMSKSLKQRLVAEGVETPEQLAFLQSYGCGEAQGYFFSRPLTAEELTLLVQAEQQELQADSNIPH